MDASVIERRISCPFCAERMSILIDASAGGQSYVEDCQVCCQPMQISFEVDDNELQNLQVDCAS
jgi:transcription elongation factor Elf1